MYDDLMSAEEIDLVENHFIPRCRMFLLVLANASVDRVFGQSAHPFHHSENLQRGGDSGVTDSILKLRA
mgnify:CR=1 FL=1